MSVVSCAKTSLPRDMDVSVNISRTLAEQATDMTLACFVTGDVSFEAGTNRVQYFSSLASLADACGTTSEAYKAGATFFAQSRRPRTLAVGRVFSSATKGKLKTGLLTLSSLTGITTGAFKITIGDSDYTVSSLDFSSASSLSAVASAISSAFSTATVPCTVSADGDMLVFETTATGDSAEISYLLAPSSGTDISATLKGTEALATSKVNGYTPTGIASELTLIKKASVCNGRPIFGWVFNKAYRDVEDQKAIADWVAGNTPAYGSLCTNSANAYNSSDTTNIAYYAKDKAYKGVSVIYHDDVNAYPDVAYIAIALSVDYSGIDTALTMKFKTLEGISTSPLTETQVSVLDSRNCNCFVKMGNSSNIVRNGKQSADSWYTDSYVNLENFREELQTEVFNVFVRKPKVPYTIAGQGFLVSAASKICSRYTRNGVFADRQVENVETETGYTIKPATNIVPSPIYTATTAQRASRIAPPIAITAYESGAMHEVTLNVLVEN